MENFVSFSAWPTSGALLWVGKPCPSLETSLIFHFVRSVVCQEDVRNQSLFEAKTHPDFYRVEPTGSSHLIKVDQIRELIDWAGARPQISARKVALIYPADALNLQAANALLKILEESMPELLFILVSAQPRTLPRTLLSRCHWIRDRSVMSRSVQDQAADENGNREQVLQDLKRIKAKEVDPTVLAAEWLKQDLTSIFTELFSIWRETLMAVIQVGNLKQARIILEFLDKIYEAKRILQEKIPSNSQSLLETLLIHYLELPI